MVRHRRDELSLDQNALIDMSCVICLELPPGRTSQVRAHPSPHRPRSPRTRTTDARHQLTNRPRRIAQCFEGHVLCIECMHDHRNSERGASSRRCPVCRNPLGDLDIRNRALETIIGCMEVQCPFQFGLARCHAQLHRKDLDEHMWTATAAHLALLDATQADVIVPVVALLSGGLTGGARAAAAEAVQHLARKNCHRLAIVQAGAIAPLLVLLGGTCGGEWGARAAAQALHNIVLCDETIPAIVEAGAIPPLVRLLGWGEATHTTCANNAAMAATRVLMYITRATYPAKAAVAEATAVVEAGAIAPLVALLGGESAVALEAAQLLVNLTYSNDAANAAIAEAGAITKLVALLGGGWALALAAAQVLTNLTLGTDSARAAVDEAGAITPLVALLGGESTLAATRVLVNLTRDCTFPHRVASMQEAGAIARLAAVLRGASTDEVTASATESATHVLAIICCYPAHQVALTEADVVTLLVSLIRRCLIDGTHGTAWGTAWAATNALKNLARFPENRYSIAQAGAMPLVELLNWGVSHQARAKDAARVAAKLLHAIADCTENLMAMVDAGAVNQLLALLRRGCGDATIKMETATLLQKLIDAIQESVTKAQLDGGEPSNCMQSHNQI